MAADGRHDPPADLTDREREALHEIELGLEWLHRANGHLVAFHHNVGHAADHLAAAERLLRDAGLEGPANALRDDILPRGVIDEGRWSYDLVEEYQTGLLADLTAFETTIRERLAGGRRHVAERRQERRWKRRADREWPLD